MEHPVTTIDSSTIYAKSPVLARGLPDLLSTFIYHLCYPHYVYPVKYSASEIILLSLLYLFVSKPVKICTRNSIDSFLITSSWVVCCEFNHSPFTIMVRVKRIFNYINNINNTKKGQHQNGWNVVVAYLY